MNNEVISIPQSPITPIIMKHPLHQLHPKDLMIIPVNTPVCILLLADDIAYNDITTEVAPFQPQLPDYLINGCCYHQVMGTILHNPLQQKIITNSLLGGVSELQ